MKIGFDAKRAFFNRSGLGNYSRNTIQLLYQNFPNNEYFLYTPKIRGAIKFVNAEKIRIISPNGIFNKTFNSSWRSFRISNQLIADGIELYHGLSNELPFNIHKKKIKSVVTIHDLIFIRYPNLYKPIDRFIYTKKCKYGCKYANIIIAISQQTKADLINLFNIDKNKIEVVYQGCNSFFFEDVSEVLKARIKEKYNLPSCFILQVGTIEERKNLLSILKALNIGEIDIPLVVVGKPTKYIQTVKQYIADKKFENIYFLHNVPMKDLPALYQMAEVFVYPSIVEGFGIPILEALSSKTPVITSKEGCFKEAGGKSSIYVDPLNIEQLKNAIGKVLSDSLYRTQIIKNGYEFAQNFREDKIAKNLMKVYLKAFE